MSDKNTNEIKITVSLDDERMPSRLDLDGSDFDEPQEAKALLLSVFDKERRDTLKIDLWTKQMQVAEMDRFMFQTLRGLADTYHNSTNNSKLASDFRQFVDYFGQQTEIIPKK